MTLILTILTPKQINTKGLKALLKKHGFDQIIKEPTRFSSTKNSCLDLIGTNSDNIAYSGVCNVNISDHELVFFTRKKIKVKIGKTPFKGRSYKNFDEDIFTRKLLNKNWQEFLNNHDPTLLWDILYQNIKQIIDVMCPLKDYRVKNSNKPWITDELLEQIKDKDRALKRAKRTKKDDDWIIARRLRTTALRMSDVQNQPSFKMNLILTKQIPRNFGNKLIQLFPLETDLTW